MPTLAKIKSIIKLANTSYQSLCTLGALNIPTAGFNHCFNCDSLNHGAGSFPHKKCHKKIAEKKKKFTEMKKSQGGSGGGKIWAKRSNKNGWTNISHKKQQSNKQ